MFICLAKADVRTFIPMKALIQLIVLSLFGIGSVANAKCIASTKACTLVSIEKFNSKTVTGVNKKKRIPKQSPDLLQDWENTLVEGKEYEMWRSHPDMPLKEKSTVVALIYPTCNDIPNSKSTISFYFSPENQARNNVDCSQK